MPEPTPTTDISPGGEARQKKLPKWALIAIIGGGVFALLLYKHKRQKEEEEKGGQFVEATTGGQTAEAVQPISSGGNLINAAHEMQKENDEFLKKSIEEEEKKKGIGIKNLPGGGNLRGKGTGRGTEITGTKGNLPTETEQGRQRIESGTNIPIHKPVSGTPVVGPSPKPVETPSSSPEPFPKIGRRRGSKAKLPVT